MSTNEVNVQIVQGKQAPKYPGAIELQCDQVVITEKATVHDLPVVDFVMKDGEGRNVVMVLTGRIVTTIASAIQGINWRNHGSTDP